MATKRKVLSTRADIKAALERAGKTTLVRAEEAYYSKETDAVIIVSEGRRHLIACEAIEGVTDASEKEKAQIEIIADGTAIEWPDLDIQMSVKGLLKGVLGTKLWMRRMGSIGGSATTVKKAQASRENGKKGGRPKLATGKRANSPA